MNRNKLGKVYWSGSPRYMMGAHGHLLVVNENVMDGINIGFRRGSYISGRDLINGLKKPGNTLGG